MEPYNVEEFTQKIKKSLQVLLYLFEAKTKIKSSATDIQPYVSEIGAEVYFQIDIPFYVSDPDIHTFNVELNKINNIVFNFFNKIVLTPKADFIYVKSKQSDDYDDMIGLFLSTNYDWLGQEGEYNAKVKFAFEYYLYYDEYDQYYG